jgi:diguanylate cyclase (GGDEF)-like protein/PAS domain S-box-containing protein
VNSPIERSLQSAALAPARRIGQMYEALSAANEASAQLHDERQLYQRICDILVQFGGMRLASVRLPKPGTHWLEACAYAGDAASYVAGARISVDPSLPEGRGLGGPAMRENRTMVCNDFVAEPRLAPWHAGARRFGFASVACVPLRRAGAALGVLIVYAADTDYFDSELVTLLERMAANVGHALERLDAERRLRESETRFRSLANLSSDWYWEQDDELRFTWTSVGVKHRGLPLDHGLGKRRWELADFTPVSESWEQHRAMLEARRPFRDFEYVRTGANGERRYIAINGEPVFHEDGRFKGYRGTARDITARKLAELEMGRLKTMHAALSSANEAILRAASPAELLSRACEIAVAAGNFVLGTAFLFDAGSGQLKRVAKSGPAAAFALTETPIYDSLVAGAWQSREVMIANDYQSDPRTLRRRENPRPYPHHLGAGAVWPLFVDGEPVGIFSLLHGEKNAFSEELTLLLQRLADNMSFALANFAHEARRLEAETELRESVASRIAAEERLQQSLERFEMVARATNDVVWDWNLVTDQLWLNDNFRAVFGYDAADVGAYLDTWTSRIHPDDAARVRQDIRGAIERGERVWTAEYRFRRKDGSYATVLDRGMPLRDSAGRPVRMIGAMVDITGRKRAERKLALHAQRQEIIARLGQFALGGADLEQLFAEAARVLRAGGCDVAAIIERVGEHGHEFLVRAACGEGAEGSVGKSKVLPAHSKWAAMLDSAASAVEHDRKYFEARDTDRPWSFWLRRLGSGVYVPIRSETAPFGILMMGSLRDAAFNAEDLSFAEAIAHVLSTAVRRHHTQTRLAYMAEFDSLTGLPNRNLLQDRLNQSIAQARRRHWNGAVLFIDLDRFKLINDTLGHHVGDRLIAEVGRRIRQSLRGGDTVGRVSGDEFGVVLTDLAQADDAALVAQKILDALGRPFDLAGNEAYVTASIGISVFPADGDDAETLLKNADMAMYRAKELTRNAYCFFTAEMNERSVAKLQLNTDLRRAIERGEFVLHYQPKVDLRDGRIHGVEGLLRWKHPQRGMVAPAEFVPALEDSGLILPVGEWVLAEAARQLAAWQAAGLQPVPVAVNLSAKQFRRRDLDALIRGVLAAGRVPAGLIELEITESCLMDDPDEALRMLRILRAAGLNISVDDFGTGYSSLSYLTRLPLTALKIDRGFVRDVAASGEAASIVRAVIDMAHNLGFTVIAEGVETEEQVAFLRRHGCDLGQGFLFGAPMAAAALSGRLGRAA